MLPRHIEQESDLPEVLNTASKQEKRAKELAAAHTGKKTNGVQSPRIQGFFSRTRIVKLVGGEKVAIQFRVQQVDVDLYKKARRVFGEVVPEITQLQDAELEALGMSVYAMSYLRGDCWARIPVRMPGNILPHTTVAESLGSIMRRGSVADDSAQVVESFILPHLTQLRDSINDTTRILQPHVERLIQAAPRLRKFPLHLSHWDLNDVNVLVEKDYTVSGIVDWECSRDLPFGVGLHRITDTVIARNEQGKIDIPIGAKEAEAAFWAAVLRNAPSVVLENLEDVQNALHIGSLLFLIVDKQLEDPAPRVLNFLAALLTYRMPQLRGDAEPFAQEYMPAEA